MSIVMNIRLLSQYVTLVMSTATLVMALMGMYLRPDRRWILSIAGFYALIDVVFYVIILVFGLRVLGNDLSPYRTVMQDALVIAVVYRYLSGDFKGWIRKWI